MYRTIKFEKRFRNLTRDKSCLPSQTTKYRIISNVLKIQNHVNVYAVKTIVNHDLFMIKIFV